MVQRKNLIDLFSNGVGGMKRAVRVLEHLGERLGVNAPALGFEMSQDEFKKGRFPHTAGSYNRFDLPLI